MHGLRGKAVGFAGARTTGIESRAECFNLSVHVGIQCQCIIPVRLGFDGFLNTTLAKIQRCYIMYGFRV